MLANVVRDVLGGIHVAIALAVPFLVAIVLFEIAAALVARAVMPSNFQSIAAPLRTVFVLVFLAIALERVFFAIATYSSRVF